MPEPDMPSAACRSISQEVLMARLWMIAKAAALDWSRHKDARQSAALAYYSVFSIGPVIVIAIAVAGLVFGREAANGEVAASIKGMLGDTGANAVQAMLADAGRPRQGLLATLLGMGALVFAAIGVVVQLKDALNIVWEVKECQTSGVWPFIRSYVVSLAAVLALGFLLLTSMIITAAVAAFAHHASAYGAGVGSASAQHADFVFRDQRPVRDDVQMSAGCGSGLDRRLVWGDCDRCLV
jgi:membrane protein